MPCGSTAACSTTLPTTAAHCSKARAGNCGAPPPRGALKVGDAATAIIRLERTRIAEQAGGNRLRSEVVTGMLLGDRKEQLLKLGALRLRCYGNLPAGSREAFIELPPDDLWIFAGSAAP